MVFEIEGGNKLYGSYEVQSAKNSVLPLLAGALLTEEKVTLKNCPNILDVTNMLNILGSLGVKINKIGKDIEIYGEVSKNEVNSDMSKLLRSSIFLLGPILSIKKKAIISYPGGCDIGLRPIDIHINGLKKLNVKIKEEEEYIFCDASEMKANEVVLELPSVGATENLIMASVLLKGTTTLVNVAREPEIVDLVNFLRTMGADIVGEGSSVIKIKGVKHLHQTTYIPIPDRIVAGTILLMVASVGGNVQLTNVRPEHLDSLISKFLKKCCKLDCMCDNISIVSNGVVNSIGQIDTYYYPAFPTDLQAQLMASLLKSNGRSVIVENLFETRFKQVPEFIKMGADIKLDGKRAIITGVPKLKSANLVAKDLRGGAGLILAGLNAEGKTTVSNISHIDRGYESIEKVLQNLGAKIQRISYE